MVDRGHWRASNKSTAVLPCYNPAACLGGVTGEPGYCSEGYAGPCELPTTIDVAFSYTYVPGINMCIDEMLTTTRKYVCIP